MFTFGFIVTIWAADGPLCPQSLDPHWPTYRFKSQTRAGDVRIPQKLVFNENWNSPLCCLSIIRLLSHVTDKKTNIIITLYPENNITNHIILQSCFILTHQWVKHISYSDSLFTQSELSELHCLLLAHNIIMSSDYSTRKSLQLCLVWFNSWIWVCLSSAVPPGHELFRDSGLHQPSAGHGGTYHSDCAGGGRVSLSVPSCSGSDGLILLTHLVKTELNPVNPPYPCRHIARVCSLWWSRFSPRSAVIGWGWPGPVMFQ